MAHKKSNESEIRPPLLTEVEREILAHASIRELLREERTKLLDEGTTKSRERIKVINFMLSHDPDLVNASRRLASLKDTLDKRLNELIKDLNIILAAPPLRPLIAKRQGLFIDVVDYLDRIHKASPSKLYGGWKVRVVKEKVQKTSDPTEERKRKTRKYWLDINSEENEKETYINRPEYAIQGIKSAEWSIDIREHGEKTGKKQVFNIRRILREAVELERNHDLLICKNPEREVLPKDRYKARDIYQIYSGCTKLKHYLNNLNYIERQGIELVTTI